MDTTLQTRMRRLLAILFLLISTCVGAQPLLEKQLTISFSEMSLLECLKVMDKQADIAFSFETRQIKQVGKLVNSSFTDASLSEVLSSILSNSELAFTEIRGQVCIHEKAKIDATDNNTVVISGYVRASDSHEELIGAAVYFPDLNLGETCNVYGFYSVSVPRGIHNFEISFLGMQSLSTKAVFSKDMVLNFELNNRAFTFDTAVVAGNTKAPPLSAATTLWELDANSIQEMPAFAGEKDALKALQFVPGVQNSADGTADFIVRGSSPGNNLILLDDAPVYNASHLLGIFSIFNPNAIKAMTLYKDGVPANFGGRSTSVLDIHMREGDSEQFHVEGELGVISAKLLLEGPIVKEKSAFIITGRRTYIDLLLPQSTDVNNLYFYDLTGKVNYKVNEKNRLFLSGYHGRDVARQGINSEWGNRTLSARWNHVFTNKIFSNFTAAYSDFELAEEMIDSTYSQRIQNGNFKYDFSYYHSTKSTFRFGIQNNLVRTSNTDNGEALLLKSTQSTGVETVGYALHEYDVNDKLSVNYGVRLPYYFEGENQDSASSIVAIQNKLAPEFRAEPRLSVRYKIKQNMAIKLAGMVSNQFYHVITNTLRYPNMTLWAPSSKDLKPQQVRQVSLGYFVASSDFSASANGYYKQMDGVVDFVSVHQITSSRFENMLRSGMGEGYGVELSVAKTSGRLTGQLGYTWSKTEFQIDGINEDEPFISPYDRTHYFTSHLKYSFGKKWSFTTNLLLYTGKAITLPNGTFETGGTVYPLFSERNGERLPNYQRLDIAFTRTLGLKRKKYSGELEFSIHNLLNHHNSTTLQFEQNADDPAQIVVKSTSYFPFFPGITYSFKF
jgi:hypothetical protein